MSREEDPGRKKRKDAFISEITPQMEGAEHVEARLSALHGVRVFARLSSCSISKEAGR